MKIFLLLFFSFISGNVCNAQDNKGEIEVLITGFRNQKGNISVNLFNTSEGFPDYNEKSMAWRSEKIKSDTVIINFGNLPSGTYAISVLHDENMNGGMEKNFLGIPREGFAFSNNFKPVFSSPSYTDAAFSIHSGKNKLNLKLIYF